MSATKPQRQQRTHPQADPIGAPSEPEVVLVPLSPEVLAIAYQRKLDLYVQALGETHRLGAGAIADLFADLVALSKTRPQL